MPLIIAVLAIIVIFVVAGDTFKDSARIKGNRAEEVRKTNASLERRILDGYIKQGLSFDEAYVNSQRDVASMGFEPCIPKHCYSHNDKFINTVTYYKKNNGYGTSCNVTLFDSKAVQNRRELLWRLGMPLTDEEIYKDFEATEGCYMRDLGRLRATYKMKPLGTTITHPDYGTCEIIGYVINAKRYIPVWHIVRVFSTQEIRQIPLGSEYMRVLQVKQHPLDMSFNLEDVNMRPEYGKYIKIISKEYDDGQ